MTERDETQREVSRRSFLLQMAAIGLGTNALAACAGASAGGGGGSRFDPSLIGLQMYTVRDQLTTDFEGTVTKVAGIGYKNLEFAGYYNRTPEQVRALLDKLGVVSKSAHVGAQLLRQDAALQIRTAKTIGQEYVTLPSFNFGREGLAGWRKAVAEFNTWGAMCRDAGLKLAFHNHANEFAPLEGTTGYDVLVKEVDPALVDFELDLYWAAFADQKPLELFARYPRRFAMWHVKDLMLTNGTKGMSPVGGGTLDFKSFFAAREQSGLKYFFVEHDSAAQYPGGSLASIQASYTYLKQLLG
jgi:sugar phosphate isomerase/epimerase